MRVIAKLTLVSFLVLVNTFPLRAQFDQWTEPGSVTAHQPDRKAELERAIEEARFRLGAFRLHPWVSLHDVAYVDNIFATNGNEEADFTASAGLGVRGYLPMGNNTFFVIQALPEYVWWRDLDERRRLNGRYGVGLFGFLSRSDFEVVARRTERQGVVTPEFEQYVHSRQDHGRVSFGLDLVRSFGLFASYSVTEFEHLPDDRPNPSAAPLQKLDRQESVGRVALRVRLADKVDVRAGVEDSAVSFDDPNEDHSNSGLSPFVAIHYRGPVISAIVDVAKRDLEPDGPTSNFVPFDEVTGSVRVSSSRERRLSFDVFTIRNLIYALDPQSSHFLDEKSGLSLRMKIGDRGSFGVFGEAGQNKYTEVPGVTLNRVDDITSYGANVSFDLGLNTVLSFLASTIESDSNIDILDRETSTLGFSIGIGSIAWP